MTPEELIDEIASAFSDAPYPGDDGIVELMDWEGQTVRRDFLGKHWRDVVEPTFLRGHNTFTFFSKAGFRFYLPAYLTGLVRFQGGDWADPLVEALYVSTEWSTQWLRRWDLRMQALTPREKHAVRLVLEFLLETQPDEYRIKEPPGNKLALALANYWNQF